MAFDQYGGIGQGLQKPHKPIKMHVPKEFVQGGADAAQYDSFLKEMSNFSQMFKFLPKFDQMRYKGEGATLADVTEYPTASDGGMYGNYAKQYDPDNPTKIWGAGYGYGFNNLTIYAGADDWNMITNVDTGQDDASILSEINSYFNWDDVSTIGGNKSYYQIAKDGDIASYTDQQAFNLMLSMLESKERVIASLKDVFGDISLIDDDNQVIANISTWLADNVDIDQHNFGALSMFFSMQTDYINTINAFMNIQTYWGTDLVNPVMTDDLGSFSLNLMTKVDSYISSLTGAQFTAAQDLKALWQTSVPRYDRSNGSWTSDLSSTSGTWAEFFKGKMDDMNAKDVIRLVCNNIFNRTEDTKYKTKTTDYENKKTNKIDDEIAMQRAAAKRAAGNKGAPRRLSPVRGKPMISISKKSRPSIRMTQRPIKIAAKIVKPSVSKTVPKMAPLVRATPVPSQAPKVTTNTQAAKKNDRRPI